MWLKGLWKIEKEWLWLKPIQCQANDGFRLFIEGERSGKVDVEQQMWRVFVADLQIQEGFWRKNIDQLNAHVVFFKDRFVYVCVCVWFWLLSANGLLLKANCLGFLFPIVLLWPSFSSVNVSCASQSFDLAALDFSFPHLHFQFVKPFSARPEKYVSSQLAFDVNSGLVACSKHWLNFHC